MSESIHCPYCGSIYEDAPYNYLIDYAFVNGGLGVPMFAQLLGLNAAAKRFSIINTRPWVVTLPTTPFPFI